MIANAAITIVSTAQPITTATSSRRKTLEHQARKTAAKKGRGGGKYQILALAKQVVGKQSRIGDFLAPSKHLHGKIPKQPHTHNPEQNLP
jgi:hypothetical protein